MNQAEFVWGKPRLSLRERVRALVARINPIHLAIGLVVLVGLGYGIYHGTNALGEWIESTPLGVVQNIVVKGAERVPPERIADATGVKSRIGIYSIPTDSVEARVSRLPGIKHARVSGRLGGKMVVKVEERQPLAMVIQSNIKFIDAEGAIFPNETLTERMDLPLLNFQGAVRNDSTMALALDFMETLCWDYPEIYKHLSELVIGKRGFEFRLRSGGGKVLTMDSQDKRTLGELNRFLAQKGKELPAEIEYVDLRFPGRIYLKAGETPTQQ